MQPFDLVGALPTGTTLLEASAGTGKTYTVGALVTRYIAEGVARIDEMLIITFGRAASQELRERVRDALVAAERALAAPDPDPSHDAVLTMLRDGDATELAARLRRVRDALSTFDSATIATTHSFCELVLRSLGVAGDTDAHAELVDSLDDLVDEVVDDLYLARYAGSASPPLLTHAAARDLARQAIGDPQAVLVPEDVALELGEDPELVPLPVQRVSFARAVRAEVERRKRRQGILSYDDLLTRLSAALAEPDSPAAVRMRRRWRIVVVDEFQDTDPVQWEVLDRAFTGHSTLVLIGDPKQAIYAFRGGDVATYLTAAATATTQATLAVNWRSDRALVDQLHTVLNQAQLGDPEIVVREVAAANPDGRLAGAPHPAPFRLRQVLRDGHKLNKSGLIAAAQARAEVAEDCAADIAELLGSGATWAGEPLTAGQIAVLVGVREHGVLVQAALSKRGVPAVVAGGGHVFKTGAADEWLALLEGLEQPHRSGRVRAAALTAFFGHDPVSLDAGGPELTDQVADRLRGWALVLRGTGVAALFEAAEEQGLSARVLATADGERRLTDLRHLAQTMHQEVMAQRLGLTALLKWFRDERARAATPERTRRLDSDAAAVQIVTIHASKGLEYPIVYVPFAFAKFVRPVEVALFHDDQGRRTLDVSGAGPQWRDHAARHLREEAGEDLRDLYVALTRAKSQVVAWWAPTATTRDGSLHRILFGRQPGTPEVPDSVEVREDDYSTRVLGLIGDLGGPVSELSAGSTTRPMPIPEPVAALAVRDFTREVDTEWRRTSYSGLIRAQEQASSGVASEPEVPALDDESDESSAALPVDGDGHALRSPMSGLPAGAGFGSLVHAVLEHADPAATDLGVELRERVAEQLRWWPEAVTAEELAEALLPSQHTPLGPLASDLTLAEIPLSDRLRELDFEFPLAGGDARAAGVEVRLREVAGLITDLLPVDDPMRAYADSLAQPALGAQVLHGYLSGSIDVVLRVPDNRFLVVDYKTNRLGEQGTEVTTDDYRPAALAEAMLHSHYPLQALLYSVVLHRYLRWRLPDYDPERHLGGVLYLYLRGMAGPQTPTVDGVPAGVFSWQPPARLIIALSELLAGWSTGGGAQ